MARDSIPVSHALIVPEGLLAAELRAVLRAIDAVHGDGELPRIPLSWSAPAGRAGVYRFDDRTGAPTRIMVQARGGQRRLAAVHEIGHFLDHQGIGRAGRFASSGSRLLGAWRDAVRRSHAVRSLAQLRGAETVPVVLPTGEVAPVKVRRRFVRYLTTYHELWARSYAQFVTARSREPLLLADLDVLRTPRPGDLYYHLHWDDEDFAPIDREIERVFRRLAWLA